ncbi:DUF1707 SHOCT-like domain-containing protein [Rhodococcus sp. NPDC004095]
MRSNPAPRLRARDSDRAGVRELLDTAYAEGQLSAEEYRQRADASDRARTLAELDGLVRDLQVRGQMTDRLPVPRAEHARRWIAGLVAAAVVVVGGAVVAARITGADADSSDARPGTLLSAAGLARIVSELHDGYGDALVDGMTVFADYASIEIPVPGAPGMSRDLRFDEDGLSDSGTSPGRDRDTVPVNLDDLDVRGVGGLLLGAPQTLGVPEPDSTHLSVDDGDGNPVVSIHLSNQVSGRTGHLTAGIDGEVRSVYRADD